MNGDRRSIAWACGAIGAASFIPCAAGGQTLTDALVSAYQHNPKLIQQRITLQVKDEEVPAALANWRPTITAQASDSYVQDRISVPGDVYAQDNVRNQYPGDSYGLSITQYLYRGGRTSSQLRQARADVKSGEAQLMSVEEAVLLQVISDYIDLGVDDDVLDLSDQRLADARIQLTGVQSQLRGGEASKLDLAAAEGAVQDAVLARAQASTQEWTLKMSFLRDTGLEPAKLAPIEPPQTGGDTLERVYQLADIDNFDVRAAQCDLDAAEAALESAKSEGRPTVAIEGVFSHEDGVNLPTESEDVEAVTLQVKVPIYSGGQLSSQIRGARLAVEAKHAALDAVRASARASAGAAFVQLDGAAKSFDAWRAKVQALNLALEGVRHQRDAGERTYADVIAAEEAVFVARVQAVQAKGDLIYARYQLADEVGQLTAQNLSLPVDTFDPEKYLHKVAWGPGR